jgi:preprotein translocase subunit SecG
MNNVLDTVVTILHIVISIALIIAVLFQKDKDAGLSGAIGGSSVDTFFGRNKNKSFNAILSRLTVVLAVLFVITSCYLSGIIERVISMIGNLFK